MKTLKQIFDLFKNHIEAESFKVERKEDFIERSYGCQCVEYTFKITIVDTRGGKIIKKTDALARWAVWLYKRYINQSRVEEWGCEPKEWGKVKLRDELKKLFK